VRSAFPKLHALEQEYGSLIKGAVLGARARRKRQETSKQSARMFSFRAGLQTLIDALAGPLRDRLHTGVRLRAIRALPAGYALDLEQGGRPWQLACRALVLTIPAHAYDELELGFDFPLRETLRRIPYPPVAGVYLGYRHQPADRPLDGFGFLIPRLEGFQILGTIWSSTVFTDRAPAGGAALTTFVGGSRQPEYALWPDGRLVDAVRQDLGRLMGIEAAPDLVAVHRWPRAIPQYELGHQRVMDAVEAYERQRPGFYVSGNFRGGISLADCVKQAHAMSERVAGELAAAPA
jgi:oxygen-dependent protoporphyrinogen oxidase